LFSGIGGLDLAAEWAGFETVLQVEMDNYATKVLEKHWPDVKRVKDIRDVNRDTVEEPVTVVSGGFPCQPHSLAGRKRGNKDERYLWPEMLRVISELLPAWVVAENVYGTISDGTADKARYDLEAIGFDAGVFVFPAYAVGAGFWGDRTFIVASSESGRYRRLTSEECEVHQRELVKEKPEGYPPWGETERRIVCAVRNKETLAGNLRGDYGISDWVDRLKCLGNAVVPQQAYPIFRAIAEVECRRKVCK
jgi:DNA (cytosine-5)-methyltransferase 1